MNIESQPEPVMMDFTFLVDRGLSVSTRCYTLDQAEARVRRAWPRSTVAFSSSKISELNTDAPKSARYPAARNPGADRFDGPRAAQAAKPAIPALSALEELEESLLDAYAGR
jgi:hypothetical protein